jgi:L,D-transpeptidase YbiS
VRLRDADIKWLFENVPVGTRVQFINEPVKTAVLPNGARYIEVHNPLSANQQEFDSQQPLPITLSGNNATLMADPSVNQQVVDKAISLRSGIPTQVN